MDQAAGSDNIVVVTYDPAWPVTFRRLGASLRDALAGTALRIDHIGSTSVPGLDAKPVIDVQISVASLEPNDVYRVPIEGLGFVWLAENEDLTKRMFREPGVRRTHIHVRRAGSWSEQFALLFRDYLRAHPGEARRYADLKRTLAAQFAEDRRLYSDAKVPFIWNVMVRADEWAQVTGWQPGPSDA